jgi:hypothetical protein
VEPAAGAAADGITWLGFAAILVALALVIGGAAWFWAWRTHGRAPDVPLGGPTPPRSPRPPSPPTPPSSPLGP